MLKFLAAAPTRRRRLLLVPAAALLALGGDGIYRAVEGGRQVAIACDQFARERPSSPRLLVAGCEIDPSAAGFRESGGQVEELFLPARPAGSRSPAPIVVATRDPAALAPARQAFGGGRNATSEQSLDAIRKIVAQLKITTVIDGLARTGFIERFRSRRILSGLPPPLTGDAVIVDLHGRPDFVQPSLALVGGGLMALAALWPLRRNASRAHSVPPSSPVPLPVPDADLMHASQYDPEFAFEELADGRHARVAPVIPTPKSNAVRLPQLLLLALDVSAGPEAIETAPPLGSRAEVATILHGVIPDLVVSASPILMRRDGSVRIDLGSRDPVPTAVLVASGEAGVALVKEVLLMTGWRAFAPKTGLFVSVDDLDALAALAAEGPVV
jgi:hypothetical protein